MAREANPRSGFTLLELILVMVIAITLCAVIGPRFTDSFPALELGRSADRIFAWARKARSEAALTGLRHRFVFDPPRHSFWIEREANPFRDPGKFVPLQGDWSEDSIPDEVTFEALEGLDPDPAHAALKVLEFRPDGTTSDARIVLSNGRDRRTIVVVGSTSKMALDPGSVRP
jgi:Tfp pilus assembly protein FimT